MSSNRRRRTPRQSENLAPEKQRPRWSDIKFGPKGLALSLVANVIVTGLVVAAMLQWWPGGDDSNDATDTPTPAQVSGEISDKLTQLSTQWRSTRAKVTYQISDTTTAPPISSTLTLYLGWPQARADIVSSDGTRQSIIAATDRTYTCSVTDGNGTCEASAAADALSAIGFLSQFDPGSVLTALTQTQNLLSIEASTETFLAAEAYCVSAIGTGGPQQLFIKWCFANNGILVQEVGSDASGQSTLTATEISQVADADFLPPYPIVEPPSPTPFPTP